MAYLDELTREIIVLSSGDGKVICPYLNVMGRFRAEDSQIGPQCYIMWQEKNSHQTLEMNPVKKTWGEEQRENVKKEWEEEGQKLSRKRKTTKKRWYKWFGSAFVILFCDFLHSNFDILIPEAIWEGSAWVLQWWKKEQKSFPSQT